MNHNLDPCFKSLTIDGIRYQAVQFDHGGWMVTKFLVHPHPSRVEQLVHTTLTRPDDVIRHAIQVNSWA